MHHTEQVTAGFGGGAEREFGEVAMVLEVLPEKMTLEGQ